jgi:hypothetical protein
MRKSAVVVLVGVLALATGSVSRAGEGCACCAAKGKAPAMSAAVCQGVCSNAMSQLTLTDEQKTKISALQAECPKDQCSKAAADKFMSGMEKILTPEQMTAFKAARAAELAKVKAACPAKN